MKTEIWKKNHIFHRISSKIMAGYPAGLLTGAILLTVLFKTSPIFRCEMGSRCRGCPLTTFLDDGDVILKPADKLAFRVHAAEKNILGTHNSFKGAFFTFLGFLSFFRSSSP